MRPPQDRRTRRTRRAALALVGLIGLVPLSACHLELTETGPKFVCDSNDYNYVQEPFGGYYIPINPLVGVFCPGYAVP